MAIKFYKLNYYNPFWTMDSSIVPYDHIETIVTGIQDYLNSAQNSNIQLWEEFTNTNFEWKDKDTITAIGTKDTIPTYLKVDANGTIYYYYLIDLGNVIANKGDETYYSPQYVLDEYMTVYNKDLQLMYEANPNIYQLFGFDNRWKERNVTNPDGTNTTDYVIDFVSQRHLSNTLPRNNMMVRELAYYTTASTLYSLNFPSFPPPATVTFNEVDSSTYSTTRTWSELTTPNSRGRYEYIICKPSSLMSSTNGSLKHAHTVQNFIVIPLIEARRAEILKALNDFDITGSHNYILDAWGDNEIGLYECDIPFSIFYGYFANSRQYGVYPEVVRQPMNDKEPSETGASSIDIPFFWVNTNAPMILKIIDYTQYGVGFYGKFKYFIEHVEEWTPDTEPALWNPTYYKEVYNNGNSNLVTDASFFIWKWDGVSLLQMGVQAYLSWQDSLNVAYNYGNNTNSLLPSLDNTETQNGNLSIANMYFGSASANFFTTNSTTVGTSLGVRASEERQSWVDAALDTAKAWNSAAPTTIVPWKAAMQVVKGGINAALTTAKTMTDTALSQQRANMQLKSQINNLTSSPASVLSSPTTKGVIPNKLGLFETYSIKLHPNDEKAIFIDYCHNGYPTNEIKQFQKIFNRQWMNVLHLDTTYFAEDLKNILLYDNDSKIFNTPYWNSKFLSWMNEPHKIYNSWWLINCTDYYGENYISNIEKELPVKPVVKTHINTLITNFREAYKASNPIEFLQTDNPSAPATLWADIEIDTVTPNGFVIMAKESSTLYYGTIIVNAICYNGYIVDGGNKYFYDPSRLTGTTIVTEFGYSKANTYFTTQKVVLNSSIYGGFTNIKNFMTGWYNYHGEVECNCSPSIFLEYQTDSGEYESFLHIGPFSQTTSGRSGQTPPEPTNAFYTQGILLSGTQASAWKSKFTNGHVVTIWTSDTGRQALWRKWR